MCGELHGVHEDRYHHRIAGRTRLTDQSQMAVMQVPHGWHECDAASAESECRHLFVEGGHV